MHKSNITFSGREYVMMPYEAVYELTPNAYSLLGRFVSCAYYCHDLNIGLSLFLSQFTPLYKRRMLKYMKELQDKGYIKVANDNIRLLVEV